MIQSIKIKYKYWKLKRKLTQISYNCRYRISILHDLLPLCARVGKPFNDLRPEILATIKEGTNCVERLFRVVESINEKDYKHLESMVAVSSQACVSFEKRYNNLNKQLRELCQGCRSHHKASWFEFH